MNPLSHFKRNKTPPSMLKNQLLSKQWRRIAALGMTALFLGGISPAHAAKVTERTRQKQAAESERSELQKKLRALKRTIDQTETAKGHASDALAQSELAISEANRALFELSEELQQTQAKLTQLTEERSKLQQTIDLQQKHLSKVLRDQYVSGSEDRMKLLLSGDNPNRINRDLHYLSYVSQAQAKMVESLRVNLQSVEVNQAAMQSTKDDLDEIALETNEQKTALEKEKLKHAALILQLSNKLTAQRKEAGTLQKDEQRMTGLVNKLAQLIEEQIKADAAAAKKQREQEAVRAQAERKKLHAKKATKGTQAKSKSNNPDAIDADEAPSKPITRNELTPEDTVKKGGFSGNFSTLRGQLRLPVRGDIAAKFGSKRGDGPSWKGLFIRTAEGAEVKAIAAGRVIFADWLRGFGNLLIIDHGNQYMTIYGNNQAVLKRTGDIIKSGDVIAHAGNSGGNEQSGLYFEMRHQGRAFDPLEWVTIK